MTPTDTPGSDSGILFVKQTDVFGGGERHLLHLLTWTADTKRPAWLATNFALLQDQARPWRPTLIDSPMIPEAVAMSRLPQFLLTSRRIRTFWERRLRELKDRGLGWVVVDSINHKLILTPLAHRLGLKVIWLEHLLWSPDLTNNPMNPVDRWLIRAAREVTAIVVFSNASRRELVRLGIPNDLLCLWRHGVTIPSQQPTLPKPDSGVIGTIGRIHQQKGLALFLTLLEAFPTLRLEIIGNGPDKHWFQTELKAAGVASRCQIIDYDQTTVSERLLTWDVFVFPTQVDNAPIAILEAMAGARPILANRVGGIHELLGGQGWLVSPSQPTTFLATLKKILADRLVREQRAAGAYRRARGHFSLARETQQFEALFGGTHGREKESAKTRST